MTPDNAQRSVPLIGKSQRVLDDSVARLRDLGYKAEATNDFADVTDRPVRCANARPGRLRRTGPLTARPS
jgi:hypothetical protein